MMKINRCKTEKCNLHDYIHIGEMKYELLNFDLENKTIELSDLVLPTKHILSYINGVWYCEGEKLNIDVDFKFDDDNDGDLVYVIWYELNVEVGMTVDIDNKQYTAISLVDITHTIEPWVDLELRYIKALPTQNKSFANGFVAIDAKGEFITVLYENDKFLKLTLTELPTEISIS